MDALQAQSESRARHEIFHNLLNRSTEPFSVVAEYFGHGMFNKLFIVEEPDDVSQDVSHFHYHLYSMIIKWFSNSISNLYIKNNHNLFFSNQLIKAVQKQQIQHAEVNPYDRYGAGAESKIRLAEANRLSNQISNAPYYVPPLPEGRMRTQEQMRSNEFERRHLKPVKNNRRTVAMSYPVQSVSKNPFDDDDDNNDKYDDSKNPFAGEDDESPKKEIAKDTSNNDQQISNPFNEYNNNLNPFE